MRPDPNDQDAYRAYAVISNAIHKAIEPDGGRFIRLSERERIAGIVWDELQAHGVEIHILDRRCERTGPLGRCKLAAGHPVGPMYDFFTDYQGHLYDEDPFVE